MGKSKKSNGCAICGRPLSNPQSLARGIGPVCAGRGYGQRIFARHGCAVGGWTTFDAFHVVNTPCYSCKYFQFPVQETPLEGGGWQVEMKGGKKAKTTDSSAILGYCGQLKRCVNGNTIRTRTACGGQKYVAREVLEEVVEGRLRLGDEEFVFEL